jgi:hypothetical protein
MIPFCDTLAAGDLTSNRFKVDPKLYNSILHTDDGHHYAKRDDRKPNTQTHLQIHPLL